MCVCDAHGRKQGGKVRAAWRPQHDVHSAHLFWQQQGCLPRTQHLTVQAAHAACTAVLHKAAAAGWEPEFDVVEELWPHAMQAHAHTSHENWQPKQSDKADHFSLPPARHMRAADDREHTHWQLMAACHPPPQLQPTPLLLLALTPKIGLSYST